MTKSCLISLLVLGMVTVSGVLAQPVQALSPSPTPKPASPTPFASPTPLISPTPNPILTKYDINKDGLFNQVDISVFRQLVLRRPSFRTVNIAGQLTNNLYLTPRASVAPQSTPSLVPMSQADLDQDGKVTLWDYSLLRTKLRQTQATTN